MTEEFHLREISLNYDKRILCEFLSRHNLKLEEDVETAFGIYDFCDTLLGCGCSAGKLLKCFAVDESLRGQNALGTIVSALLQDRFSKGIYDVFVITRTYNEVLFQNCGMFPVVRTESLVMLENRNNGAIRFAKQFLCSEDEKKVVGAIVMNCNPFTLGHRYLVEQAASQCDVLHLFVVEEDRSLFPTQVRFQLVQEGVRDLSNVRVHLSGPYMISAATFPKYFLKETEDAASLQSELDITLFAESIAPALHITKRFAGQEPIDLTTARYNDAMRKILPQHGISFVEIPRKEIDALPISASRVRTLLASPDTFHQALSLLPLSTQSYLLQEGNAHHED